MTYDATTISRRTFGTALLGILVLAAVLRGLYPAADPPWYPSVGVVWHDEGAWVHNARNKALFGAWSQDAWNPMYIAPVFTGLEYVAFRAIGVGVRQARLVPEIAGLVSVWLLALGVARLAGRRAGLMAALLLATNYVYVMWNRAALMEGPMVAFLVASWYCYVRAETDARWGWAAGACALLAFFTKAAAAFFVAALALDAVMSVLLRRTASDTGRRGRPEGAWGWPKSLFGWPKGQHYGAMAGWPKGQHYGAAAGWPKGQLYGAMAWTTLGGLAIGGALALAVFVGPNWADYRFYNWQMSVTRKPAYDLKSLVDRVTWFPILHDLFTRMWFVVAVALAASLGMLARWRQLHAAERLLLLWIGLGAAELMLHDVGNERRFVLFIPALVGVAAIALGRDTNVVAGLEAVPRRRALLALPLVLFACYVVWGAIVRLAFLYEIRPNVRLSAALAALSTAAIYATWPRLPRALSSARVSPATAAAIALLVSLGQVAQYVQWAAGRTYKNYQASIELGRRLAPGTLVHGKLANGLALENRIRPVFVGRGFGNYEDRKTRDDVRYILTYVAPSLGYESQAHNPVIGDVIAAYPQHSIVMTFDVAETATGHDRAALIDKFGGSARQTGQTGARAKD